jgi:ABC-type Fe3+-hydroxamate transport system substrate-binding protein
MHVKRHPQSYRKSLSRSAALLGVVAALVALSTHSAMAGCAAPALERSSLVVIGDPIAAVCYRLGVAPLAWVGRRSLMENGDVLAAASEVLGCPNAFCGPRQEMALKRIVELAPEKLLITPTDCKYRPDLSYEKPLRLLKEAGFQPVFIDFAGGPEPAVRRIAAALDRAEDGERLIRTYEKGMRRARNFMARVPAGLRLAVVAGTFQEATGKSFLRLEAAGGYSDDFLLKPLQAVNVAGDITGPDVKIDKGHIALRSLEKVLEARPDAIAVTGDPLPVFRAMAETLAHRPDLATVPAARQFAVYPLPFYAETDPLAYPEVLTRWALALAPFEPTK